MSTLDLLSLGPTRFCSLPRSSHDEGVAPCSSPDWGEPLRVTGGETEWAMPSEHVNAAYALIAAESRGGTPHTRASDARVPGDSGRGGGDG